MTEWPRQKDVQKFYGAPGTGFVSVVMPFKFRIAWEPEKTVQKITVHHKCAEAFKNVWAKTLAHYGIKEVQALRLDMFGGCVNVRKMRGSNRWSMHAYGCAWDIDPGRNSLQSTAKTAQLAKPAYKPFWDIVYSEGGLSLGLERNYDWMHWQFTRDFS